MTKPTPHVFTNLIFRGKNYKFVRQAQDLASDYETWTCSDIGISVHSRYDGKKIVWFAQLTNGQSKGIMDDIFNELNNTLQNETYSDAQIVLDVFQQIVEDLLKVCRGM
jgi:hypothetical protein